jgi:hypothetical protein
MKILWQVLCFMLIKVKGTKEHFLVITSTFVFDILTLFNNTFVYYWNIHFYNFLFAFVSMEMLWHAMFLFGPPTIGADITP